MGFLTAPNKINTEDPLVKGWINSVLFMFKQEVQHSKVSQLFAHKELPDGSRVQLQYSFGQYSAIHYPVFHKVDEEDQMAEAYEVIRILVTTPVNLLGYNATLNTRLDHEFPEADLWPLAIDSYGYAYVGDFDSLKKINWRTGVLEWSAPQSYVVLNRKGVYTLPNIPDVPYYTQVNACHLASLNYAFARIYDLQGNRVWYKQIQSSPYGAIEDKLAMSFQPVSMTNKGPLTYVVDAITSAENAGDFVVLKSRIYLRVVDEVEVSKVLIASFQYTYSDSYSSGEHLGRVTSWPASWYPLNGIIWTSTSEIHVIQGEYYSYISYLVVSRDQAGPSSTEYYRSEIQVSDNGFLTSYTIQVPDFKVLYIQEFLENSLVCLVADSQHNFFLLKLSLSGDQLWIMPVSRASTRVRVLGPRIYVYTSGDPAFIQYYYGFSVSSHVTSFIESNGVVEELKSLDIDVRDLQVIPKPFVPCEYEEGTEYGLAS